MEKTPQNPLKQQIEYLKFRATHKQRYGLQTPKGKIIEKFRNKDVAVYWRGKLEREYLCELKIVKLNELKDTKQKVLSLKNTTPKQKAYKGQ